MTENQEIEIARIVNLINEHLEGLECNMAINVLTNILIVQIINASPEEKTLSWIKNKCNELCSDMYKFIEIIYKEKFPNGK